MPRMMIHQQLHDIVAPHDHDVLSGRGNFVNYHAGNEHFRSLVRKHKVAYVACPKQQKGKFSRLIVEEIRARNPPGRFLKQDPVTKLWHDIGEKKALDKTRQALREGAPEIMREITGDDDLSPNEDGSDDDLPLRSQFRMVSSEGTRQSPTGCSLPVTSGHSQTGNKQMFASGNGFNSNNFDGFGDDLTPASIQSGHFLPPQQSSPMQQQTRLMASNGGIGNDLLGQHSQHSAIGQSQHGNLGRGSQHGGLGRSSHHGGLGQNSQHGSLGHNSQHGGLGQNSQHGSMGRNSQHGNMGQNSQHGNMGRSSQHSNMARNGQLGGVEQTNHPGGIGQPNQQRGSMGQQVLGPHNQHGSMGRNSQHGMMAGNSQHGMMGQHSQQGGMGQQSLHSGQGQCPPLDKPLGHHSPQNQLSPNTISGGYDSNQVHPGMRMSELRQHMQNQQQQEQRNQMQSTIGGQNNIFGADFTGSSNGSGVNMFQTSNREATLQSKIASLTQMQQTMFAQQNQYQQQKQQLQDDDNDDFEFEPRPIAPGLDSMQVPQASVLTNESVGVAPQLRKVATTRISRRGDMEREGSERSLKMDSVFSKELSAPEGKTGTANNLHGSNGSVMSISIGELGHDIDGVKEQDSMPPPKSLNAQELFEGAENQDELAQLFDSSMRLKQQQQQMMGGGRSRSSQTGDASESRSFEMSVATLGDSGVMYTGDTSLGMSMADSFSNVFDDVEKDLYVGSN